MKKDYLIILFALFVCVLPLKAQVYKTINIAIPGTLKTLLSTDELKAVTDLTLTGVIDQRDFVVMKDNMPVLANINMKNVTVKAYDNDYLSNAIPNYAFCSNDGLFIGKTSLKSIILPSTIKTIEFGAFSGCTNLINVELPSKLYAIDNYAFDSCSGLTSIVFPSTLTTIGDGAFYGCSGLTSLVLPDSLTTIGDGAFYGCYLTSCKINAKVAPIMQSSSFDSKLVAVYVSEGAGYRYRRGNYWASRAIIEGEGTSLHLNITTTEKLASEIIAAGVSLNKVNSLVLEGLLDESDFAVMNSHMLNLVSVDLSATKLKAIPESAFMNKHLLNIILPDALTTIGNYAFKGCIGLTSIVFPSSLSTIGEESFSNCTSLTSITFPSALFNIKSSAFSNCTNLMEIKTFCSTPQKITADIWDNVNKKTCKLVVPKGHATAYMTGSVWSNFMNVSESDIIKEYRVTVVKGDGGLISYNNDNLQSGQALIVPAGQARTFKITPNAGFSIGKVYYNKEDVTSQLKEGCFTTLSVNAPTQLSVNFVQNQYSVSIYTIGTGGVINNLTTSGSTFPTIYFKTNKDSKLSSDKDSSNNDAITRIASASNNVVSASKGDVTLVIDFRTSEEASPSFSRAKAWTEKGKIYVKSDEKMNKIELLSLSGQPLSKQQVKKDYCQMDMKNEKLAIVKVTYNDTTSENIMVVNKE
jgi:hypothetical protein